MKLPRTVLQGVCSWRGDGDARILAEYRQIHDLNKEERKSTTREVAASGGQKLIPHMLIAHHQTKFWKAAEKQVAPAILITVLVGRSFYSIPSPVIASGLPAPPELMKAVCQCKSADKAYTQWNCIGASQQAYHVRHTVVALVRNMGAIAR